MSLGSWLKQRCRGNVGPGGGKELQMIADWRREDVCSGRDLISRIGRKGRGWTKYGEDWREGEERKGGGKERGAGGGDEEEEAGGRGGGERKKRQPQVSSGFPFAPSSLGQRSSGKFILLGFFVVLLLGDLFTLSTVSLMILRTATHMMQYRRNPPRLDASTIAYIQQGTKNKKEKQPPKMGSTRPRNARHLCPPLLHRGD